MMIKLKSAVVGFSYLAGLIFAFLISGDLLFNLAVSITGIVVGVFLLARKLRPDVGMFLLMLGIAFLVFAGYKYFVIDFATGLDGQKRYVDGLITDMAAPSHDMAGYTVEAVVDNKKVGFSLYALDVGAKVDDVISFEADFTLLRDNTAFAESSYYMSKGIFLKATASTPLVLERHDSSDLSLTEAFTNEVRDLNLSLREKVITTFPNDTGALICAVFLGDRSEMSQSLSKNITRAGASHYTSVSGLHLTLIAHLFVSLMNLTKLRFMRRGKVKFVLLLLLIITFMVFFNLSASVLRSGLILIIFYGGELFMRRGHTLNSIGVAALIILLPAPYACLDAGFLLSIAGTIGIGVIAPAVSKRLSSGDSYIYSLRKLFIGNLCANYATLPLVAIYFGGASLASPIVSIILLPLFTVMLSAMLIYAVVSLIGLGGLSLLIAGITARIMGVVINFFGDLKFSYIPLDYSFVMPWVGLSIAFTIIVGIYCKDILKSAKACMISIFALSFMIIAVEWLDLDNTRLEIYTDGNSAAVFLRHNNTAAVIVTSDSARTAYATGDFISDNYLDEITLLAVLNSSNNYIELFEELPAKVYSDPYSKRLVYDVSGIFTVELIDNENNYNSGAALITYGDTTISVAHVRSSSDADINITYGYSVHTGDLSGLVINTSRRQEAINLEQINAYYEKIDWIIT